MVYSKEHFMNMAHGFDVYKPLSSYQQIMISDRAVHLQDYIEEDFYTKRNFKTVYNIDKELFDSAVNTMYQFAVLSLPDNQEMIEDFFNLMIDRYGVDKIFKTKQQNILNNEYSALSPQAGLNYVKLSYIRNSVDQNVVDNFIMSLMTKESMTAVECIKNAHDYKGFRAYKKDHIDKLTSKSDKLIAALAYLYANMCTTEGPLEKLAVDYFMNISGLKYCFRREDFDSAINHKRSEVKKWLSSHKRAKNFHDLTVLDKNEDIKKLVYQLFIRSGFALYDLNLFNDIKDINQDNLLALTAFLDDNSNIYNTPEKTKELLLYLFYAVSDLSERCMGYTEQYLNSSLSLKHASEKALLSEVKLRNTIENNDKLLKNKQDSLNKLQLEYDRLKDKEIVGIKSELEKYKQLVKELQGKNSDLENINVALEKRLKEVEPEEQEEKNIITLDSDIEKQLKKLNIVVMGGHQVWQNKLKDIYPYFTYIDADNVNFDINNIKNADYVLFNTLHCSHSLFYKVKNNMNIGRKNESDRLVLVSSNNLAYFKNLVTDLIKRS